MAVWIILSRWVHIVSACLALGGVFFMRIILPIGLSALEPEPRQAALLRARRAFKMVIHPLILLFLVTGIYNSILNFPAYNRDPGVLHMLWGIHVLLALAVFSIAIYVLAGPKPPPGHRGLMLLNVVLLMGAVLAASTLKWARENSAASQPAVVVQSPHP